MKVFLFETSVCMLLTAFSIKHDNYKSDFKEEETEEGKGLVCVAKNCALGLERAFQDIGHNFLPYGPSSQQITFTSALS